MDHDQMSEELKIFFKDSRDSRIIVFVSFFVASIHNYMFVIKDNVNPLSFAIFSIIFFLILTIALKMLKYFKNTNAYFWFIPIALLCIFNVILNTEFFSFFNLVIIAMLFAIYLICAMNESTLDIFNLSTIYVVISTFIGNLFIFTKVIKKGFIKSPTQETKKVLSKILLGTCFAIPVVFIIFNLLASADAVFNNFITTLFDSIYNIDNIDISGVIFFIIVFIYTIGYIAQSRINFIKGYMFIDSYLEEIDIIVSSTFLILLNMLFLLFFVIQVAFLFTGGFMELPQGVIYSEYAREGFFQLLLVIGINFFVIIIFLTSFVGATESKIIKNLLLSLCLFTSLLIASSFYRMYMYVSVYGYTSLRACVITFLFMSILLITLSVLKLFNKKILFGKWFSIICFVFYFIANITGSDYFINFLNKGFFIL